MWFHILCFYLNLMFCLNLMFFYLELLLATAEIRNDASWKILYLFSTLAEIIRDRSTFNVVVTLNTLSFYNSMFKSLEYLSFLKQHQQLFKLLYSL